MRYLLAVASLLVLAGCAARAVPVAIGVACYACQWVEASGVCAMPGTRGPQPSVCPPGYQPYMTNFEGVFKRGEQPRIVCR